MVRQEGVDDHTDGFVAERARLTALAGRLLGDHAEGEDVVQQAWLRLRATGERGTAIQSLPAWLTTVTTRLCLDRMRSRVPRPELVPEAAEDGAEDGADPSEAVALADTVGVALHLVLDRLTPAERVAFVLHDSFDVDFTTVAAVLDTTPAAARKLASRARAKVRLPHGSRGTPDSEVVDAFMAAARGGDVARLLRLLAPDAEVGADEAARLIGTPIHLVGRREVAEFFDGAAHAALPVLVEGRPAAAWFHRGVAQVVFDVTVRGGLVSRITFRADPAVLAQVVRRDGHTGATPPVTMSTTSAPEGPR